MTFIPTGQLSMEVVADFLFLDVDAVDQNRGLVLYTTNGRTRNTRRWFVQRYNAATGRIDRTCEAVKFRAWTFSEALQRLEETRIKNRIDALIESADHAD